MKHQKKTSRQFTLKQSLQAFSQKLKFDVGKVSRVGKTGKKPAKPVKPKKLAQKKLLSGAFSGKFAKKPLPLRTTATFRELPQASQVIETYQTESPYSKISIASIPELGGGKAYYIKEVKLEENETVALAFLNDIISKELEPLTNEVNPKTHVAEEALRLSAKYGLDKAIAEDSWPKIQYYLQRNLIGFGDIDVIMHDPMIEDISVNGVGLPVYVWHRKYESIPTNLVFTDEVALNNLIVKLTHMAPRRHVAWKRSACRHLQTRSLPERWLLQHSQIQGRTLQHNRPN